MLWTYEAQQLRQATATIERSDRKVERLLTKIQLQLFSSYKYSSRIVIILWQNIHIGICNGAAMEEAIWKSQSTGVWQKKGIAWHIDASILVCTFIYNDKLAN